MRSAPRQREIAPAAGRKSPADPPPAALDILASAADTCASPAAPEVPQAHVQPNPAEAIPIAELPQRNDSPAKAPSGDGNVEEEAAAAVNDPPPETARERAAEEAPKKKRANKLEAAEKRLAVVKGKLDKKRAQIEKATSGSSTVRPSDFGKVKVWQADALALSKEVEAEEAEVDRVRVAYENQLAAVRAKAAAAALASEASRGM